MAGDNDVKSSVILDGNADGLIAAMQKAHKSVQEGMEGMGGVIEGAGKNLEKFIGIFGTLATVVAGGAAFKSIISETVTLDLETAKLSKTLGDTLENTSIFKVALHGFGIEQDVANDAILRMTRTLNTNSDMFRQVGVDIDGMRKSGASTIDILMATLKAIGQYKEGFDQNQAAMAIFSKSWDEVRPLMKLLGTDFEQVGEKARELNLIVGEDGVKNAKEYKKNIQELKLVQESIAHTAGTELVGALVDLGKMMEGPATKAAHTFAVGIHEIRDGIRDTLKAKEDLQASLEKKTTEQAVNWITLLMAARAASTGHFDQIPTIFGAGYQAAKGTRHDPMDMSDMTMDGVPDSDKPDKKWTGGDKKYQATLEQWKKEKIAVQAQINEATGYVSDLQKKEIEINKKADELLIQFAKVPGASALINQMRAEQLGKINRDLAREMQQSDSLLSDEYLNAIDQLGKTPDASKYGRSGITGFALSQEGLMEERNMLDYWEGVREEYRRKEEQADFDLQQKLKGMAQTTLENRLGFLGQNQDALVAHYDFEKTQAQLQFEWTLEHTYMEESEKARIRQEFNAKMVQMEQEKAQRLAELWWNNSQTYLGFAQQMTTMGLQYLMFDESQRSQIGKRILATSIRFMTQGLQQYMFSKAKEHVLNAAAAAGKTTTDMAAATANLGILEAQSTAWAAFFTAMSLNPFGGQAFIPAATAMTAVAGGAVPAAMGAVAATGSASVAAEWGMAAAWAGGGILVGALGEAGATAIEGGTTGNAAGYGAGTPASPVITQPVQNATTSGPNITIYFTGTNITDQKYIDTVVIPGIKDAITRGNTIN